MHVKKQQVHLGAVHWTGIPNTMNMVIWIKLALLLQLWYTAIIGEMFTSTSQLVKLVTMETEMLSAVTQYLIKEQHRLATIRQLVEDIRSKSIAPQLSATRSTRNGSSVLSYVGHPVNAYHLIRQWQDLHKNSIVISGEHVQALESQLNDLEVAFPSSRDVRGAAEALLRLQETYDIPTADIAEGRIQQSKAEHTLLPSDSLTIGQAAKSAGRYDFAIEWLHRALENDIIASENPVAWRALVDSYIRMGNYEDAAAVATRALQIHSMDDTLASARVKATRYMNAAKALPRGDGSDAYDAEAWRRSQMSWKDTYYKLCRGEELYRDPALVNRLHCTNKQGRLPYINYKEEILNFNPRISLFHDVISDAEIDFFKAFALPELTRARVGDPAAQQETKARVGKLAWLWDSQHTQLVSLSRRVADITGLDTTYTPFLSRAEPFQVVNYGMAGQYEPHYDYYDDPKMLSHVPDFIRDTGDRVATFMFYLSDVLAGGATVFPEVNVRVPAVKGGAAFWYNLQRSGAVDSNTQHAGCPVLLGEKWIANKWIREYGQEKKRPCGLSASTPDTHL